MKKLKKSLNEKIKKTFRARQCAVRVDWKKWEKLVKDTQTKQSCDKKKFEPQITIIFSALWISLIWAQVNSAITYINNHRERVTNWKWEKKSSVLATVLQLTFLSLIIAFKTLWKISLVVPFCFPIQHFFKLQILGNLLIPNAILYLFLTVSLTLDRNPFGAFSLKFRYLGPLSGVVFTDSPITTKPALPCSVPI